jgi:hypothetical protein
VASAVTPLVVVAETQDSEESLTKQWLRDVGIPLALTTSYGFFYNINTPAQDFFTRFIGAIAYGGPFLLISLMISIKCTSATRLMVRLGSIVAMILLCSLA